MLSYRHAFHAGNHADVLKHMVLCLLLRHLNKKDKPYAVLDTHAGAGMYALNQAYAQKNSEYMSGIGKILHHRELRDLVPEYYQVIDSINTSKSGINFYPGSPLFSCALSRESERIYLCELHRSEFETVYKNFKRDRRVSINHTDGFEAMKSMLPLNPKRGLCLIDPSYELKSDYTMVLKALKTGLSRFPTGIFAIWYPVLGKLKDHSKNLTFDIKRTNAPLLQVELNIDGQSDDFGMNGSGMLIVNYPYGLYEELEQIMGPLFTALKDGKGSARLRILNEKD